MEDKEFEILVVDDNSENIQTVGNILSKKNYSLRFAGSGQQALQTLQFGKPDLILLDIAMPGIDGFAVCEKIKANPDTNDIPIIYLTAKTQPEDIIKGLKTGAVDYIKKPFNNEELQLRVKTHLELKHSRDIINQQKQELTELNTTKDKFFSIIAHDLKNPFQILKSLSKILKKRYHDFDDDKKQNFINSIHNASTQGYELLDNLLQWSRSKMGTLEVQQQEYDIHEVVEDVIRLLNAGLTNKNIAIENNIDSNTKVFIDKNLISSVIRNLISNAIKFTKPGGRIAISAEKQQDTFYKITVSDTGIGIAPHDQQRLFRIDTHHTTKGTNKESGTGLGLLLCKEFVEKHNGRIWVESAMGKGSKFMFTIPDIETSGK